MWKFKSLGAFPASPVWTRELPKLSAHNTGYLVTQTQFIKNSPLTSSPFLPCQTQNERRINRHRTDSTTSSPCQVIFFFFLTNEEFYSVPGNSGYIALHIFQASCLHPRQGHLSATKSISLSHTFENRQAVRNELPVQV